MSVRISRLTALLLALLLLSGCGGAEANKTAAEPTAAATEAPTAAPGPAQPGLPAVDNRTVLPDGEYTPDPAFFSFSGGTGKARFSCRRVIVREGASWAELEVSSDKYTYFRVGEELYYTEHGDGTSRAEIPFRLNAVNTVVGQTTAMSAAHEIEYKIFQYIPGALSEEDKTTKPEQLIPGLVYESTREELTGGACEVYAYQGGCQVIWVKDVGRYLLLPPDTPAPEALPEDVQVISLPLQNVYVGTRALYEALRPLEAPGIPSVLTLVGFEDGGKGTEYLGAPEALDLAQLLRHKCSLAILPAVFADPRVAGQAGREPDPDLDEETAATLRTEYEALREFGIPAFVEVSDPNPEDAPALYALLLGGETGA